MTMSNRLLRNTTTCQVAAVAVALVGCRTFAAAGGGGKSKKSSKGSADVPKVSTLAKEVKTTAVVGANVLKEGSDPKIMSDSDYPDWLWHLLNKQTPLSELKRKKLESLSYEDLKRFFKLDNRARIKENNSIKAKN